MKVRYRGEPVEFEEVSLSGWKDYFFLFYPWLCGVLCIIAALVVVIGFVVSTFIRGLTA